jgi:hypothetical protein
MNDVTSTQPANRIPGLALTDHRFEVPLDYEKPARKISIFVREVVAAGKEKLDLPYLVFFQAGRDRAPRGRSRIPAGSSA